MKHLSRINSGVLLLIILVNCYVILTPVLPMLALYSPGSAARREDIGNTVALARTEPKADTGTPNSILVPAMELDRPILEGRDTYKVLNEGILRWPASSTPDKGSNTVLLAHRFTYGEPRGTFYYLDKLKPGDKIGLVWNDVRYAYSVTEVRVIKPTETAILAPTKLPRLTLFTCTPLLWPKDRLVVTAEQTWPLPYGTQSKETSDE